MTVRELREALQAKDKEIADATANYEAQLKRTGDKQSEVDQKNRAIDDLNAELKKRRLEFDAVTPEQAGRDLYEALTLAQVDALSKIRSLTAIVAELKAHGTTHEVSHDDFISGQLLNLQTAISEIREYHDIKAMPTGDIRPDWITQNEADLEALAEAQIAASGLGI
jgi:predicted  nucleic acid-binding Zn-ribbon protein